MNIIGIISSFLGYAFSVIETTKYFSSLMVSTYLNNIVAKLGTRYVYDPKNM